MFPAPASPDSVGRAAESGRSRSARPSDYSMSYAAALALLFELPEPSGFVSLLVVSGLVVLLALLVLEPPEEVEPESGFFELEP
jgi:hypothetical protein